ncbi:MAG: histidine phosphatase family protein [Gemmatimonadota bacterium]
MEAETPSGGNGGTRLYLVRHALTGANSDGRRVGELDVPLSRRGRAQARQLARRACDLAVDVVLTSPLARARQTARFVAKGLGAPVREEPDLREMALGPWEGLSEEEIRALYPEELAEWQANPRGLDLPGHEGLEPTRERVVAVLERLLEGGERALCVTHLTVLRVAWTYYTGRELNAFAGITPGHGQLFELARVDGRTRWSTVSEGEP